MALAEMIRCWSMRLNRPDGRGAQGHMENVGFLFLSTQTMIRNATVMQKSFFFRCVFLFCALLCLWLTPAQGQTLLLRFALAESGPGTTYPSDTNGGGKSNCARGEYHGNRHRLGDARGADTQ